MTSKGEGRRHFFILGLSNFWRDFRRSKRGLVGVVILIMFASMAVFAPLITPYNPVSDQFVAGAYSAPAWFRFGQYANLYSENVFPVQDPTFSSSSSIAGWQINSSITSNPSPVTLAYDANVGSPKPAGSGPGSLRVIFSRDATTSPYGTVVARVFIPFKYSFPAPPDRFLAFGHVKPDPGVNVTYREFIIRQGEGGCPPNRDLNVSIGYRVGLYPGCYPLTQATFPGTLGITGWASLGTVDTSSSETLAIFFNGLGSSESAQRTVFPGLGDFAFGIEMVIPDKTPGPARVDIHFDDVELRLLGRNFGLLGTDQFGVDLFSQLVYGSRVSLLVGLLSAIVSVVVGLVVGLLAGYTGGLVDELLMRFNDMLLVLPGLPLLIVLIAILGASIWNVILVIGFLGWMGFARVVRAQVVSLKERPFVEAAKAVGAGSGHIIKRHIIPNVMSLTYVTLALSVPSAITSEAALSFLGLSDPTLVSWGKTLNNSVTFEGFRNLWWVIPPGLAIATISLSFILLGYALDEILNPRLRLRR